eukprot:770928-Ditylum_brightwellii.AAC.3
MDVNAALIAMCKVESSKGKLGPVYSPSALCVRLTCSCTPPPLDVPSASNFTHSRTAPSQDAQHQTPLSATPVWDTNPMGMVCNVVEFFVVLTNLGYSSASVLTVGI